MAITTLSQEEVAFIAALFDRETPVKVNMDLIAQRGGYSTKASANTAWWGLRKKLGIIIPPSGPSGANMVPKRQVNPGTVGMKEGTETREIGKEGTEAKEVTGYDPEVLEAAAILMKMKNAG